MAYETDKFKVTIKTIITYETIICAKSPDEAIKEVTQMPDYQFMTLETDIEHLSTKCELIEKRTP